MSKLIIEKWYSASPRNYLSTVKFLAGDKEIVVDVAGCETISEAEGWNQEIVDIVERVVTALGCEVTLSRRGFIKNQQDKTENEEDKDIVQRIDELLPRLCGSESGELRLLLEDIKTEIYSMSAETEGFKNRIPPFLPPEFSYY
jgi:uncharacterized protein YicC (UPF0701 family)